MMRNLIVKESFKQRVKGMSKSLIAIKCADGWLIEIKDTRIVGTKSDVLKCIRQEGLKRLPEIVEGQIAAD